MSENKASEKSIPDFNGQRPDESTLFLFRRSLTTIKKSLLIFILIILAIWGFFYFFNIDNFDSKLIIIPTAGLIIGILIVLRHIFNWYFTMYIVTNQRVRYMHQKGIFRSEVIDLPLSKIENISYNIPGFIGSIFHFGTIIIQTLAGDLVINHVAHPDTVYNKLQNVIMTIEPSTKKGNDEEDN